MSIQALGQALVIVGFLCWLAAWVGLGVVGAVDAGRHRPAPAVCAILLSVSVAACGIAAMALLPGRFDEYQLP